MPLNGLSNVQLAEHYADCIKLSAENVSAQFSIPIISYTHISIFIENMLFSGNFDIKTRTYKWCLRCCYFNKSLLLKNSYICKLSVFCRPLLLPFSAMDGLPAYLTVNRISLINPIHRFSGRFITKLANLSIRKT